MQRLLNHAKALFQLFFNFSRFDYALLQSSFVERKFNALLNVFSEAFFDELRHFFAKHTMTVADREKMRATVPADVWQSKKRVLVHLLMVARIKASLGNIGEL